MTLCPVPDSCAKMSTLNDPTEDSVSMSSSSMPTADPSRLRSGSSESHLVKSSASCGHTVSSSPLCIWPKRYFVSTPIVDLPSDDVCATCRYECITSWRRTGSRGIGTGSLSRGALASPMVRFSMLILQDFGRIQCQFCRISPESNADFAEMAGKWLYLMT